MGNTPPLAATVLEAIAAALPAPADTPEPPATDAGPRVDALRVLAVLVPVVREAMDRAAGGVGSSPVRAAAFLRLTEEIYRQAGYGQLLAASHAGDAALHTITEEPLAALNELLADPAAFAAGTPLPGDVPTGPGCGPLYRDETDFLADQLNLTHFQAKHRVQSAGNLLPHRGFNGREVPPKFPLLGRVLTEAAADPRAVASLAIKFGALAPCLAEGEAGNAAARDLEAELADAARTRNAQGTARLLKDQAKRLDDAAGAPAREAAEDEFVGAYYLGHTRKGYEYKVITTAEGHELLATAADILNSPRTKAGTPAAPAPEAGPPIPEWAIDPDTPAGQRPVDGFTDLGVAPEPDPVTHMRPGETIEQALTRQRAMRLHQLVLDALRMATSPGEHGSPAGSASDGRTPLAPNFTMNVTITLETFLGQLDAAGVSDHGEDISAASCRRIACNAGIIPIVLDGDGVPLELGRTRRYFNRAQRRAIAARDKGCANPGCTMGPHRCEAHHLDPWNLGGRTDVSRGCLLCPMCHQAYHAGKFRIEMIRGIPHVIPPASRDPLQIPRRNWIFHPAAEPRRAA